MNIKKKGFTLIELLAVIVILTIIALIVVPTILNIINDSKDKACSVSKKNYIDAVEHALLIENLTTEFNPTECIVTSDGNIECDGVKLTIEIDGDMPIGGKLIIEDGQVISETLEFKDGLCSANSKTENESSNKCKIIENGTKVQCDGYEPIEIPENSDKEDGTGEKSTVPDKDSEIIIVEDPIEIDGSTCSGTMILYVNGKLVNTKVINKCFNVKIYLTYVNDETVIEYLSGNPYQMYCFQHETTEQVKDSKYLRDCRYIGNTPYNYVIFNDETWRIIGKFWVYNGKEWEYRYKIIKDDFIEYKGGLQWDKAVKNDWAASSLNTYLNDTWYNSLSVKSQKMIGNTEYYLGSVTESLNNSGINYYTGERSYTKGAAVSTVSWIGKIGLMYPSEYVYTFSNGVDYDCFNNNGYCVNSKPNLSWLFKNINEWLITPFGTDYAWTVFALVNTGHVNGNYTTVLDALNVRPVIYLKSNVKMISGTGKLDDPYNLYITS